MNEDKRFDNPGISKHLRLIGARSVSADLPLDPEEAADRDAEKFRRAFHERLKNLPDPG